MGNCFVYGQSGGGTAYYDPVFANNSWEAIIEACQKNKVPNTWIANGTCHKGMMINGVNYRIDIIGKNHDTYASGGTAPLTFQMHDCYEAGYAMHNNAYEHVGWQECTMRTQKLPAILKLMPTEVQAAIKEVQKKTSAGDMSSTIVTTNDKLFLLSEVELFGVTSMSFRGEGAQYYYYETGNTKVKIFDLYDNYWWERSPSNNSLGDFCLVRNNGTAGQGTPISTFGVAFAFCF